MGTSSNNLLAELQAFIDQIPFAKRLSFSVVTAKKGHVVLSLAPQSNLFNHFNTYQAGVIYTLAEVTGGALCGTFLNLKDNLVLTKRGEIDYLKGTNKGLRSEALLDESSVVEVISSLTDSRKTDLTINISIKTEEWLEVAQCRFFYYLRRGIPRSLNLISE